MAYTNTICFGQKIVLNAYGANSYSWCTGSYNNTIQISPQSNTIITISGTNTITNCSATASLALSVKECNTSGLKDNTNTGKFVEVYPNPSDGAFAVHCAMPVLCKIYNTIGAKLFENALPAGENKLQLQHAQAGIYLVSIAYEDHLVIKRLVIE